MKKFLCFVLVIAISLSFSGCFFSHKTEAPPKITEGDFPFYVEFTLNGETYIYEDTVVCNFYGYDGSAWFVQPRMWTEKFKFSDGTTANKLILKETNSKSVLVNSRINNESQLMLSCGRGDYYMGESDYYEISKPCFYYHEKYQIDEKAQKWERTVLTEEQLEEYFGLKIIRFEFSEPIQNEFKYD